MASFYEHAFNTIARKTLNRAVRGAIWARELVNFPDGFADMEAKYSSSENAKRYVLDTKGKTFEELGVKKG